MHDHKHKGPAMNYIKIASSVDLQKSKSAKKGIIPFILTKKIVDRDSEVVLPEGIDTSEFVKNPVFLWAHDYKTRPPLGKILADTIQQTSEFLKADVEFDMADPFAAMIYNKYLNGYLNAGSIRFMATELANPIMEGQKGATIVKSILIEFSAAPLPANPEALAQNEKQIEELESEIDIQKQFTDEMKKFNDPSNYIKEITKNNSEIYIKEISSGYDQKKLKKNVAVFHEYTKDIPDDAVILDCSDDSIFEIAHPFAGKTLKMVDVTFHPPFNRGLDKVFTANIWLKENANTDEALLEYLKFGGIINLTDRIWTLAEDGKSISDMAEGYFSDLPIKGLLTDLTANKISAIIRKQNEVDKELSFSEAVSQMDKLLNSDSEFLSFIKQEHYRILSDIYNKNGKTVPVYREGSSMLLNVKSPDDKKFSEEQIGLLLEISKEIVARVIHNQLRTED